MTTDLHHVTSNTGHVATTPRSDVADDVIAMLRPIVEAGGGQVPHTPEWHLDIWPLEDDAQGAAAFQVARGPASSDAGQRPYVMCLGCWQPDSSTVAWRQANQLADMMPGDNLLPKDPPAVPWLSVTFMPAIAFLPKERIDMLGDFERLIFWTLAES